MTIITNTPTKKDKVRQHLLCGYKLNGLIALKEYGVPQNTLNYYIWCFRHLEGIPIKTRIKETVNGCKYAEFYIDVVKEQDNDTARRTNCDYVPLAV